MYKVMTAMISDSMYKHLEVNNIYYAMGTEGLC